MDAAEQLRIVAKRARERKNMRQEDVAAELKQMGIDITSNAYAKFEGGTRGGKFDEVAAIAQVLELDLTAITRSIKRDVVAMALRRAENNYARSERMLENSRQRFEDSAQALNATRDLSKALGGEVVNVRMSAEDFAAATLLSTARLSLPDTIDFVESLGDDGTFRKVAEGYDARTYGDEDSNVHLGGHDDLAQGLADAFKKYVPALRFPDE